MEIYCKKLREWAMEIVNYEINKKMTPLAEDENDYHEKQSQCFICNKRFYYDDDRKTIKKFVIIVITLVNIEFQLTVFVICGIEPPRQIL